MLSYFNKSLKKNIIVVCHGEMELLPISRTMKQNLMNYRFLGKVSVRIVRKFFGGQSNLFTSITFVVLGDSILENIKKNTSSLVFNNFCSLEHPFVFKYYMRENNLFNKIVKIGILGSISNKKNGKNLDYIISNRLINNSMISINIIGSPGIYKKKFENAGFILPENSVEFLPRSTYDHLVSSMDYIVFLYEDSYQFTASGALFDAIKFGLPVISLNNQYFEYIASKFSFYYESHESIESLVKSLNHLKMPANKYDGYLIIENINKFCDINSLVKKLYHNDYI
jgi:hypothetical protein